MRKVIRIANKVRKQCEELAFSHCTVHTSYHKKQHLRGMCAIASSILVDALKQAGEKAIFKKGNYNHQDRQFTHCWVEWNGYIIDITATQFGGPKVRIRKTHTSAYTNGKTYHSVNWSRWPWCQRPSMKTTLFNQDPAEPISPTV